jgi:D-alanyl-lipoteichoic acid acyltransferase DltB (MBOAT superfamily)
MSSTPARSFRGQAGGTTVVPHDTPEFWTSASTSVSRFWRRFHASFFVFYSTRVYAPLGGGTRGVFAAVLVSTAFHGFSPHWTLWGVVTGLGLALERKVKARAARRTRGPPRTGNAACAERAGRAAIAAIAQTATVATFIAPAVFPGLPRATIAKVMLWGVLVSLVWHSTAEASQTPKKEE